MTERRAVVPIPLQTSRDVLLFEFQNKDVMVVSCDSSGGVGPKPFDKIKVDGYTVGKFSARVALMEVLATGAIPICLTDTLSVEMNPTGLEILEGVKEEAEKAGLDPKLAVTGSSEKNFIVEQTGIGVTVIGITRKENLRIGVSRPNDAVVAIGIPSVGGEVVPAEKQGKTADCQDVLKLLDADFVHEIIPVGSTGIAHEIEILAKCSRLGFKLSYQSRVDIRKSAGPGTVALVTLSEAKLKNLESVVNKSLTIVGYLT